ncbi:hypothetical protein B0H13DRAFT_1874242 [Mycena leptocephala]|nr:hypothetical protein B0H13DRAFT_1874242 [Mycena leptocephala]
MYQMPTEHHTIPGGQSYKTLAICELASRLYGWTSGWNLMGPDHTAQGYMLVYGVKIPSIHQYTDSCRASSSLSQMQVHSKKSSLWDLLFGLEGQFHPVLREIVQDPESIWPGFPEFQKLRRAIVTISKKRVIADTGSKQDIGSTSPKGLSWCRESSKSSNSTRRLQGIHTPDGI